MSILAQSLRRPKLKPKWQAPLGVMESVVAYNCRKHGFPIPVLCMPFWEGAGNKVFDVSGKMNHGTMLNGAKWVAGMKSGNAIAFDGTNDYVNCGNAASLNITGSRTITAWFKAPQARTDYRGIIIKETTGSYFQVLLDITTGKLYYDDEATTAIVSVSAFDDNKWHQVVAVRDDSAKTIKLYADTVVVASTTYTGIPPSNTNPLWIGRSGYTGGSYPFNGSIDDVRIYNRALTAAQIKYLYDNPYFMYEMPEELWGYTAAVSGATHPGWLWNKSGWF